VLGEKIFAFFHFFKSYFKLLKLPGACLRPLLEDLQPVKLLLILGISYGLIRPASNNLFFSERSNIAQIFEGTQACSSIFLLPLIIAAWL
jgi:hypothetical protein